MKLINQMSEYYYNVQINLKNAYLFNEINQGLFSRWE